MTVTNNRYVPLYSTGSGLIPSASDLNVGELAVNVADGRIYSRDQNNNIIIMGSFPSASFATTASFASNISGSKKTLFIPVGSMWPRSTTGSSAVSQSGLVAGGLDKVNMLFDANTPQFAQFTISFPKSWDKSSVTARFYWNHDSSSVNFNAIWGIQTMDIQNANPMTGSIWNVAQEITGSGGIGNYLYITSESAAISVGTPLDATDLIGFQVYRNASSSADTLAVSGSLLGVKLFYRTTTGTDD